MGGPLAGVACPSLPDVPGQRETSRAGLPNTFCILAQQLLSVGETPAAFWRCRNRALDDCWALYGGPCRCGAGQFMSDNWKLSKFDPWLVDRVSARASRHIHPRSL